VADPNIVCDHTALSGFTEQIGERTGTRDLWVALRLALSTDPHHAIRRHPWRENSRRLAQRIALDAARDEAGKAIGVRAVSAYSWGGPTALDLCSWLWRDWGMAVDLLVLIDPVPRRFWRRRRFFSNLGSRALGSGAGRRVEIPASVSEVWVYRQVNKQSMTDPMGAAPKLLGPDTVLGRHVLLGRQDLLARYETGTETEVRDDALVRHCGGHGIDTRPAIHAAIVAGVRSKLIQFRNQLTGARDMREKHKPKSSRVKIRQTTTTTGQSSYKPPRSKAKAKKRGKK
jgi:hypothetical protein